MMTEAINLGRWRRRL